MTKTYDIDWASKKEVARASDEAKEIIATAREYLKEYALYLEEAADMGGTTSDEDRIAEVENLIVKLKDLAK